MKTITIDYELYQKELSEASLNGSKLTPELIKKIESHLALVNKAHTWDELHRSEIQLRNVIAKIESYGELKK
jgi:hypothetical protein